MRPGKPRSESNRASELLIGGGPVPIMIKIDIREGNMAGRQIRIYPQRLLRVLPRLGQRFSRRQGIRERVEIRQSSVSGIQLNGLLKIVFCAEKGLVALLREVAALEIGFIGFRVYRFRRSGLARRAG